MGFIPILWVKKVLSLWWFDQNPINWMSGGYLSTTIHLSAIVVGYNCGPQIWNSLKMVKMFPQAKKN